MLFPDDALFAYVLTELEEEIAQQPVPPIAPLPCDRWVARSCLQKAIRRSDTAIAQQALANLLQHDARAAWRSLAIIACEDVGVANIDVLAQIIAAQRDRDWRRRAGGDWRAMAELVRQMAESEHCQAACDLLLRAINAPQLDEQRAAALEATIPFLAASIVDATGTPLEARAISVLALAGGLAEGQQHRDPCAAFDLLADTGFASHVVATCRSAWKLSRNPMALLLPLVWERWMANDAYRLADDPMPPVEMIAGVPGYSLDQFTRIGNSISRAIIAADYDLRRDLSAISSGSTSKAFGDVLFLLEGSALAKRVIWSTGEHLRLPHRQLLSVASAGSNIDGLLAQIAAKGSQLASTRQKYFHADHP